MFDSRKTYAGERGRTTSTGFQDRRIRPLCHPSDAAMMRVSSRSDHCARRVDTNADTNPRNNPAVDDPKAIVRRGYDLVSRAYRADDADDGMYADWIHMLEG